MFEAEIAQNVRMPIFNLKNVVLKKKKLSIVQHALLRDISVIIVSFYSLCVSSGPEKNPLFCFAGDNEVLLADGSRKSMSSLSLGDRVLALDEAGNPTFSPVILFLERGTQNHYGPD